MTSQGNATELSSLLNVIMCSPSGVRLIRNIAINKENARRAAVNDLVAIGIEETNVARLMTAIVDVDQALFRSKSIQSLMALLEICLDASLKFQML